MKINGINRTVTSSTQIQIFRRCATLRGMTCHLHERNGWPGSGIWGLASGREVGTLGAVWSSRMEAGADSRRLLQAKGAGAVLAGSKAVQNPSKSDGIQVNPTKKVPAYGHQMTNGAGGRLPGRKHGPVAGESARGLAHSTTLARGSGSNPSIRVNPT